MGTTQIKTFTIGELSSYGSVKITTIRHYERIGLMPEPPRTLGGRRLYDARHIGRLNFIRHARELGFTVEEVRALLRLTDAPELPCKSVDTIARQRLRAVDDKMVGLKRLRAELSRMIAQCEGGRVAQCRIIETLSRKSFARA
ncbi:MAG: helix-turn-helix domain-containing protein [Alphaproteobacteria bacterium]|nr:helix-turn-helix domain-containing protein [Reyranella sp.]MBL6854591.1 helix-turn-helix domain-containing protein [Alphaproteobacteria bacterium]MBL6940118.1 helix-turn-helix domain-containing protein [Alphaproteobacteria bacterium]MBL7100205.1 helix-turn-helix domain-containing protein [Alphaproteobacteria bacterium]